MTVRQTPFYYKYYDSVFNFKYIASCLVKEEWMGTEEWFFEKGVSIVFVLSNFKRVFVMSK